MSIYAKEKGLFDVENTRGNNWMTGAKEEILLFFSSHEASMDFPNRRYRISLAESRKKKARSFHSCTDIVVNPSLANDPWRNSHSGLPAAFPLFVGLFVDESRNRIIHSFASLSKIRPMYSAVLHRSTKSEMHLHPGGISKSSQVTAIPDSRSASRMTTMTTTTTTAFRELRQTKIVKVFRDQRPRHLSCILNLVVASIVVVVVVFHRLAPLSAAAASFAWSPTSNRDFTSRRASSRFGRAEKNAARRETLIIIMIRFNLFCHAD